MIEPNEVCTPKETRKLLKVSQSTIKRMLKSSAIRANKVGGQYRIWGHCVISNVEILQEYFKSEALDLIAKYKPK